MIKKFRKKPVVVEAMQLTLRNIKEVYELVYKEKVNLKDSRSSDRWDDFCKTVEINGLTIPTLEDGKDKRAKHVASIGDWIIKGISGEFYPCKPDIFEKTYESVE